MYNFNDDVKFHSSCDYVESDLEGLMADFPSTFSPRLGPILGK